MKYVLALSFAISVSSSALADGDVDKGEKVFRKCKACHMVGENAKTRTGPVLNDLWGRTAAGHEDYAKKYSKALKAKGEEGLIWNDETINAFVANPKKYIKGTRMAIKIKKEDDRDNLLAYLKQFSKAEDIEAANAAASN